MNKRISRRGFMHSSLLASAALPLALRAQEESIPTPSASEVINTPFPEGKIAGQSFSRLMMGGNLIAGYSHSRDLSYVSMVMRRYNTPSKIRQTLELGETSGITAINTWVMDDNSQIFEHWKAGGKMKWFAQARLDGAGGFSQIQRAIDEGAVGIHLTGDACENLIKLDKFDKVGETVEFIKAQKRIAGVAAHDLEVIVQCERAKMNVDFYQKTLHSHEYYTSPRPGETEAVGLHDNSWCKDPQAVIDFMAEVNAKLARRVAANLMEPGKRSRPWA